LEKAKTVEQKRQDVLRFLDEHAAALSRQGSVSETRRGGRGGRTGKFYELRCRLAGRQRCVYLGRDETLAEEVRDRLRQLQAPRHERRGRELLWKQQRAHGREIKARLNRELATLGLRLQGYELRGVRKARLPLVRPSASLVGLAGARPLPGHRCSSSLAPLSECKAPVSSTGER
jgi:hypothetical protein